MNSSRLKIDVLDLWSLTPYYERYLVQALQEEGVDAALCATSYPNAPSYFQECGLPLAAPVDRVAKWKIKNEWGRRILKAAEYLLNQTALLSRWTQRPPDVLHIQWLPMLRRAKLDLHFLGCVERLKIPTVYTVHNLLPHNATADVRDIYQRLYARMDQLICHNQASAEELEERFGIARDKISVIPHGPLFHELPRPTREDARKKFALKEDDVVFLWQGVISPYKGIDFLLDAWTRIQAALPNAKLVIAGTGKQSQLDGIRARIANSHLESSLRTELRFIETAELPAFFVAADVLVYPYSEVTTSGALMTGLTYNKAILATDIRGFRDVLPPNTASFVPYGDVTALAAAITTLVERPELRKEHAAQIAILDTQNAWHHIAKQTVDCYNRALQMHASEVRVSEHKKTGRWSAGLFRIVAMSTLLLQSHW